MILIRTPEELHRTLEYLNSKGATWDGSHDALWLEDRLAEILSKSSTGCIIISWKHTYDPTLAPLYIKWEPYWADPYTIEEYLTDLHNND